MSKEEMKGGIPNIGVMRERAISYRPPVDPRDAVFLEKMCERIRVFSNNGVRQARIKACWVLG